VSNSIMSDVVHMYVIISQEGLLNLHLPKTTFWTTNHNFNLWQILSSHKYIFIFIPNFTYYDTIGDYGVEKKLIMKRKVWKDTFQFHSFIIDSKFKSIVRMRPLVEPKPIYLIQVLMLYSDFTYYDIIM
jgi:hypothetical protein